jgi:HSP20 family protein
MRSRLVTVACVTAFVALLVAPTSVRAFNLFPAHWGNAESPSPACSQKQVQEAKERALLTHSCPRCGEDTCECDFMQDSCPPPPPVDRGTHHGPLGFGTAAAIRRAVDRAVDTARVRLQNLHFPGGSKKKEEEEEKDEKEAESDARLTSVSEILDDLQRQLFLAKPGSTHVDSSTHETPLSALARASANIMHVFPSLHLGEASDKSSSAFRSAMDVSENDELIEFTADVPGAADHDITVEVMDNDFLRTPVLVVKGKREVITEENTPDGQTKTNYHRRERHFGKFENRYALPVSVDVSRISAKSHNGVLTITAPKKKRKETPEGDTDGYATPHTKRVTIESA